MPVSAISSSFYKPFQPLLVSQGDSLEQREVATGWNGNGTVVISVCHAFLSAAMVGSGSVAAGTSCRGSQSIVQRTASRLWWCLSFLGCAEDKFCQLADMPNVTTGSYFPCTLYPGAYICDNFINNVPENCSIVLPRKPNNVHQKTGKLGRYHSAAWIYLWQSESVAEATWVVVVVVRIEKMLSHYIYTISSFHTYVAVPLGEPSQSPRAPS